jgi:hypothetical protein
MSQKWAKNKLKVCFVERIFTTRTNLYVSVNSEDTLIKRPGHLLWVRNEPTFLILDRDEN